MCAYAGASRYVETMANMSRGGPDHFILNAGRKGPYRFFDSGSPAKHYGGLAVFATFLGGVAAYGLNPSRLLQTWLIFTVLFIVAVLLLFGYWATVTWWRGEVHFVSKGSDLVCWHGTQNRRVRTRRFDAGRMLTTKVDSPSGTDRIVISQDGKSMVLGAKWDIDPDEFTSWKTWLEKRGWRVDDFSVRRNASAGDLELRVAGTWVDIPFASDDAVLIWAVPHGPAARDRRITARQDWLPGDNGDNIGEFSSGTRPLQITAIVARLVGAVGGEGLVEFGGSASGATIMEVGIVLAELEFASAADAVSVRITPEGRMEMSFRKVTGQR